MQDSNSILGLLTILAVAQFSPGPDMLLLLKNSFNGSRATGLATVAGIVAGLSIHITLVFTGFQAIDTQWPQLTHAIRIFGAAYISYLGFTLITSEWRDWKSRKSATCQKAPAERIAPWRGFRQGLITNLLNAKAMIFFATVLSPFASPNHPVSFRFGLGFIILVESWILWSVFVLVIRTEAAKQQFFRLKPLINGCFALLLIGISMAIAINAFDL